MSLFTIIFYLFYFSQEELCNMINKKYVDFLPSLHESKDLMMQVDEVSKEMDALKNCIENEVCVKVWMKHYRITLVPYC